MFAYVWLVARRAPHPVQDQRTETPVDIKIEQVGDESESSGVPSFLSVGSRGKTFFSLSVTLDQAYGLMQLPEADEFDRRASSTAPGEEPAGFWFSYNFCGVLVQTEVFYTLQQQQAQVEVGGDSHVDVDCFPPICDTFRFKSCLEV